MTIIGKSWPVRAAALRLSSANRRSSPDTSLPGTECLDIFSPPPGDRDVISQALRDSSSDTKIAPRSVRIAARVSRGASSGIVASRVDEAATSLSGSARRQPDAHGILGLVLAPAGAWPAELVGIAQPAMRRVLARTPPEPEPGSRSRHAAAPCCSDAASFR